MWPKASVPPHQNIVPNRIAPNPIELVIEPAIEPVIEPVMIGPDQCSRDVPPRAPKTCLQRFAIHPTPRLYSPTTNCRSREPVGLGFRQLSSMNPGAP